MTHGMMLSLGTFALAIPGAINETTDLYQKSRKKRGRPRVLTFREKHPKISRSLTLLMVGALVTGFWLVFHPAISAPLPIAVITSQSTKPQQPSDSSLPGQNPRSPSDEPVPKKTPTEGQYLPAKTKPHKLEPQPTVPQKPLTASPEPTVNNGIINHAPNLGDQKVENNYRSPGPAPEITGFEQHDYPPSDKSATSTSDIRFFLNKAFSNPAFVLLCENACVVTDIFLSTRGSGVMMSHGKTTYRDVAGLIIIPKDAPVIAPETLIQINFRSSDVRPIGRVHVTPHIE